MYAHRVVFASFVYGFIIGLLLPLTGNTFNFWMSKSGFSLESLGLFSFIALPYSLKYIIAPIIDRTKIPLISLYFSNRKAWILSLSTLNSIFILILATLKPEIQVLQTALLGFLVSFCSASLDIALNANRIEVTPKNLNSQATSIYIIGYRLGMLTSGAGAIYLSFYLSWQDVYSIMGYLSCILTIFFIFYKLPINDSQNSDNPLSSVNKKTSIFWRLFIEPFKHMEKLSHFMLIMLFLALYKASDNMVLAMLNHLVLSLGFNEIEISLAGKFCGITASIFGGILAGTIIPKITIKRSLLIFGLLHSLSYLLYFPLINYGHNLFVFFIFTLSEAFTGGMSMVAYLSYISSLCKGKYIGTQYAIFFSVMGFSRFFFPCFSGFIVSYTNWNIFFISMIIFSLPALFLIRKLPK